MKVPFLKEKRRSEMLALASDFSNAICAHLSIGNLEARLHAGWLNRMYSMFALLEILLDENRDLNPSREYALEGTKRNGASELFLKAMRSYQASADVSDLMQRSYSATIFSGFVAELKSDILMVFLHGLFYSYRGAAISLRCAMEDLYRHLYYKDHLQEYMALRDNRESEHGMKLGPQGFREYLSRTAYLQKFKTVGTDFSPKPKTADNKTMDLFGLNDEMYGALSAAVHGASDEWFAALETANSLTPNSAKDQKLDDLCTRFCKLCTAFLLAAHRDIFSAAGEYDKSIVLDLYSSAERRDLRLLLNL